MKGGNSLVAERTLSHIQLQVKETASTRSAKFSDLFRDKATIKGMIIILGLFAGQQFCGIFAMVIIGDLRIVYEFRHLMQHYLLMNPLGPFFFKSMSGIVVQTSRFS